MFTRPLATLLLLSSLCFTNAAQANERHFTYTYESAVLPAGAKEIEVWTTPRLGRDDYFARFDQRIEFEVGLTDNLQTAFYLNWRGQTVATEVAPGMNAKVSSMVYDGVSSEWKYKFTDPVAHALGFALYGEATLGPAASKLEAKAIFDKRVGKVLLAANIVSEVELEFEGAKPEPEEIEIVAVAGATVLLTDHLAVGLELRNHNDVAKAGIDKKWEWEHSALFLGPVVSYATKSWWMAFTLLPQLPALKKHGSGSRVLDGHEAINARLLLAFHID